VTYCLAVTVPDGLVFCSDSRTSAGVDMASTYSKMFRFGRAGERQLVILSAGNLATTQGVLQRIERDIQQEADPNLMSVGHLAEAADYIGELSVALQGKYQGGDQSFEASFILGGQIGAEEPRIHMVYPQGNHITTSADTPYLQIGEIKYGKPILDRIITADTPLDRVALAALVSMDSTMRSNLSVGPPFEIQLYLRDSLTLERYHRFDADSEYLREIKRTWNESINAAFNRLPPIAWAFSPDGSGDAGSEASPPRAV
jgi:putative proteasome-type protease